MFTIGIDVGGTYTDLVAIDETGKTVFAKSPSTPSDQSVGVMAGLEELARRLQMTRAEMLGVTDRVVHGTTVATNALLERRGALVALLTTEGHRDVIEMREGLKGDRYDLRSPPPEPLVPRERRFGVKERLKANGEISTPLDDRSLGDAISAISASGATSVAVCFLHSYLNPVHEIAAVKRLAQCRIGARYDRRQRGVPVMGMQHIGPDEARGGERGRSAERHIAMQIVGVVRAMLAVNSRAIEASRMIDQIERHADRVVPK